MDWPGAARLPPRATRGGHDLSRVQASCLASSLRGRYTAHDIDECAQQGPSTGGGPCHREVPVGLSVRQGRKVSGLPRSAFYYRPVSASKAFEDERPSAGTSPTRKSRRCWWKMSAISFAVGGRRGGPLRSAGPESVASPLNRRRVGLIYANSSISRRCPREGFPGAAMAGRRSITLMTTDANSAPVLSPESRVRFCVDTPCTSDTHRPSAPTAACVLLHGPIARSPRIFRDPPAIRRWDWPAG